MRINFSSLLVLLLTPLLLLPGMASAQAGGVAVAFPDSLALAMAPLSAAFQSKTGNSIMPLAGPSSILYARIAMGGSFDVFLADNSEIPKAAIAAGVGVPGTSFTYAVARIVLFSADPKLVKNAGTLKAGAFHKLAIADAKTGPFGTAPLEVMKKLGVYDTLAPKLVTARGVGEAYQFANTRQVDLAFVAQSQLLSGAGGSQWVVPQEDYTPIPMDAVLLTSGKDKQVAKDFLEFLKSDEAVKIIDGYGFGPAT